MESGLFVQIDDPYAEGMILAEALGDDYYEFNEERMIFFGRRKRRTFRIGDTVRIRVVRATIDDRKIDLALVEHHARQNQPR
jgi:ribonuclease R